MEINEKITVEDAFEGHRRPILDACLAAAPFDGWTARMLDGAARAVDIDKATTRAAFPRGIKDVLQFWSQELDLEMGEAMAAPGFSEMRIRDKVAAAVTARLDAMRTDKEAARRAAAVLAAPPMAPFAAKMTWASADTVWRGLGDRSTDFNYYTKRTILAVVISTTLARWLADDSEDEAATQAFLAARIDNVMQIEKVKAQAKKLGVDPAAPISFLARLRYPLKRRT